MCHAAEPVYEGIARPPNGVMLENDAEIAAHAREIYIQAGRSHAMPPGNITDMTPDERKLLVAWFESAVGRQNSNDDDTPARPHCSRFKRAPAEPDRQRTAISTRPMAAC